MSDEALIDARKARDFLAVIDAMTDDVLRGPEYRRGAAESTRMMRLYLDALIEDPKADRSVAA